MDRIVASIISLPQHFDTLRREPIRYRPVRCPKCGFGRLWGHGYYWRKVDRHGGAGNHELAPVPRFRCNDCGGTCSRLPACIAPRRWHGWQVQQDALRTLVVEGSVRAAARVAQVCRHTVRRWRGWLAERGEVFAFHLTSRFPDWARVPDRASFWREVLVDRSLQQVMAVLDTQLTVP
jgi:transposase-like protein